MSAARRSLLCLPHLCLLLVCVPYLARLLLSMMSVVCALTLAQIILVTGANKGIGYEAVRLLSQQQPQSTILLAARSQTNGEAALEKLGRPANVKFLQLDVTDKDSIAAAVAKVKADHGRVDILIHNAGILLMEHSHANATSTFETNLFGVKNTTDAFLPLLPDGGFINIVSSELGNWAHSAAPKELRARLEDSDLQWPELEKLAREYVESTKLGGAAHRFPPTDAAYGAYGASKMFVSTYGRILGRQLKSRNIPVINTSPGYCATDLTEHKGTRTATQGGESIIAVLTRGVEDSGKLFTDNRDVSIAS